MIGGSGSCNKATVDDGITPITEKRCCEWNVALIVIFYVFNTDTLTNI